MSEIARLSTALSDRYAIVREIGRGGMATVYLAHDIRHDRDVAIKVLHADLGAALGGERFLAEIKTTARLQHPHILPLLDSGTADSLLFYVMPHIAGESLRDRLAREQLLPIPEAVRIAREIASALDYAHRHGVIHRDIKPENILLHDGQALVADFGIALAVRSASGERMTQTGLSLGTPQYMSPEQAMGEKNIDARSDIYALGAVTYEMLAGEPPFSGASVQAIVAKVLSERPTSLRTLRDTVPEALESAVLTALAKLPADRFASAAEFSAALTQARETAAGPALVSGGHRTTAIRARRMTQLLAGIAVLSSVGFAYELLRPRPATSHQVVRFLLATPDSEHPIDPAPWPAAISPDGGAVVYGTGSTYETVSLRWIRTDQLETRPIPGSLNASQVMFSPDGQWIAFEQGTKVKKVRLDGSAPATVAEIGKILDDGGDWMLGDELVFGAQGHFRGLSHVSANGGEPVEFAKPDSAKGETDYWYPIGLDDDHTVAFALMHGSVPSSELAITSLRDGKITPLGVHGLRPLAFVDGALVYAQVDGTIMALRLDSKHRAVGKPFAVLDPVQAQIGNAAIYISRGGALVSAVGALASKLVWVGKDGVIRPVTPETRGYSHARLSPGGERIALTVSDGQSSDIWLYDLRTATYSKLTNVRSATSPSWTADGKQIYFVASTPDGAQAVFSQPADGSGAASRRGGSAGLIGDYSVSPDGRSLVYQTWGETGTRIMESKIDSTGAGHALLGTSSNEAYPTFSPDGRWVAFATDETGVSEVFVRAVDGGGRSQISAGGGVAPHWSRDGKRLYYLTGSTMLVAKLSAGPSAMQVASRDTLLRHLNITSGMGYFSGFDVSADESRFLALSAERNDLRLAVVPNWVAELREKLAAAKK